VEENCKRLGVTCVTFPERDPARPGGIAIQSTPPIPAGSYDKILIDAPCSNTGVLRRRVDLRWRIKPEEIARLRQVQSDLLNNAARTLKPGGVIVYSTCSLEPQENEDLLAEFLKSNGGFKMASQRALRPFADNVDGAFVAKLVRT
jgi:16S rRNA (cytosine967-C5)-methyltransferase